MSTHNIGFYEVLTKIIFELSSNTHLISSAEPVTSSEEQIKCVFDDKCKIIFVIIKTYVVDAHQNRFAKVILMSTHNISLYEEISKSISYLSNHQICTLFVLLLHHQRLQGEDMCANF